MAGNDDIRNTPFFRNLVKDAPQAERDHQDFKKEYGELVRREGGPISMVLRCHLIVEHFLDSYLAAANPDIEKWEDARLSFVQKVTLADRPGAIAQALIPGLRSLNRLRNKLAHDLQTELSDADVAPMKDLIDVFYQALGIPTPNDGFDYIQQFTMIASGWFHGTARTIRRRAARYGLAGLEDWYDTESQ